MLEVQSYRFEDVLIYTLVAQWLEVLPVKRGFSCAWASGEYDEFDIIDFRKRYPFCAN